MFKEHGAVIHENMYAAQRPVHDTPIFSNPDYVHNYGMRQLQSYLSGLNDAFSPVIGNFMNPWLEKINVIRGLDITVGNGHNAAHLGNFHTVANGDNSGMHFPPLPTIDQVMASSSSFYGVDDPHTVKTINISTNFRKTASWYRDGNTVTATPIVGNGSTGALFESIFGGSSTSNGSEENIEISRKISLLDKIKEDYNRLLSPATSNGRRLNSDDRIRLQQYFDELNDLERRLANQAISCETGFAYPDLPLHNLDNNLTRDREYWNTCFDIIVSAFRCGKSRIATLWLGDCSSYTGNYHLDAAHSNATAAGQAIISEAARNSLQYYFVPLLQKLEEDMGLGDGTTYLDNSAVVYQHEAGPVDHNSVCMATIVAGSAGAYFNTGYYVDYEEPQNLARWPAIAGRVPVPPPGIRQNRFLFSLLEAMGVPRSDYATGPLACMYGYGDHFVHRNYQERQGIESYPQYSWDDCNKGLPGITNGSV